MGFRKSRKADPKSVVVAGEFNAGKTSTINLMLRREILAASADYSMMPPARIFASKKETLKLLTTTGKPADAAAFRAGELDGDELSEVEIGTDLGDIKDATITEVSVGLNGRLDARSRHLMENADVLVWCTMGQRAWALTEITVVKELPERVHENAILVMTRADYLRDDEARALVQKRLDKEASAFFGTILQVSASRKAVQESSDPAAWAAHGGSALHDAVVAALAGPAAEDAGQAAAEPETAATEDVLEDTPEDVLEAHNPAAIPDLWTTEIDGFVDWLRAGDDTVSPVDVVHRLNAMLHRIEDSYKAEMSGKIDTQDLNQRFDIARDLLGRILKKPVSEDDALQSLNLLLQLEDEMLLWSGGLGLGVVARAEPMIVKRAS